MEKITWMLIPLTVLGHSDLGLLRSISVLLRLVLAQSRSLADVISFKNCGQWRMVG